MLRSLVLLLGLVGAAPASAAEPSPIPALVRSVDIPYQQFTLSNGLRVLVHTDRKAPVVAISIWYHVGSKDEPPGKTGFAHLFEHLMFNGSENAPGDFFEPLQQIGATDLNGTTWFDRTNYYETVPTGALDRALFLESDRMGHLVGGIDQAKLDNQRAVVQNEKRQGDNEPFGTVDYIAYHALFPDGHPYRHQTIGSMGDLNRASLGDVKQWFGAEYGPNNAVLVLAGDLDLATARAKAEKWFGAIPRGPRVSHPVVSVPSLPTPKSLTITDRVPFTRVMRMWTTEGVNGEDTSALEMAMSVLGGLSSSRLDNQLVRADRTAVAVSASLQPYEQVGVVTISADVKAGVDPQIVARHLDTIVAEFLAKGPTKDELQRAVARTVAGTIAGYESVGGKAVPLAEGLIYSGDPETYKKRLADFAALTPDRVRSAAARWLARPVLALTVKPGSRDVSLETLAILGDAEQGAVTNQVAASAPARTGAKLPDVGQLASLAFPAIERAQLTNGIKVYLARRTAIPAVRVAVSFDVGFSADPKDALGTQSMMLSALDEGTATRSSVQIAEEQERLGASISSGASIDRSTIGLFALKPNLAPSIALLADVVRNPAFRPSDVEKVRGQQLARLSAELSDPADLARHMLNPRLYGLQHPYGVPSTGTGEPSVVSRLTGNDLARFHHDWFWSGNASIFVVGDVDMATLKPVLEQHFGNWRADRMARPVKQFDRPVPDPVSKIYLVDRPGSGQSMIRGGIVLKWTGRDDLLTVQRANDVIGGSFLSRINMDLRETKGWSYGVGSLIGEFEGRVPFIIVSPVQADRTGESLQALIADLKLFLGSQGTSPAELERTVNGAVRGLPGSFEASDAVLAGMQKIIWLDRPDDYYARLPQRLRALTPKSLDASVRGSIDPARMIWIVVGDAKTVRPQLEKLGLPIEVIATPAAG